MSHWLRALLPPGQPLCLPSRCHLLSQVSPEKTLFSPKTQGPRMDLPQTLGRFLLGCDSELLATCAGWTPQRWCPGRRGLPSPWESGQGVLSLLLLGILWPRRMGCPTCYITCTATPSCWDATISLPRPYLPTAKTVRPTVRFRCTASCWATSGSKVPSQIMGAPQEVQVRTSGRALAGAGRERQVHPFTCWVNVHCHPP